MNQRRCPVHKLAVLASGAGSILSAILAYPLLVDLVLADRDCNALKIARKAGVQTQLIPRSFGTTFTPEDRSAFSLKAARALEGYDVVAMAGFGTKLAPIFFRHYRGVLVNTHPSLLPLFKGYGRHVIRQTLEAGATLTGCTVHVVTEELDAGPILAQQEVPVLPGDTEATLHERIKAAERVLYPATLAKLLARNS